MSRAGAHDGVESAASDGSSDLQLPTDGLRIPRCCLPPPLIQKRFISHISHVETETLNLILDPPHERGANIKENGE